MSPLSLSVVIVYNPMDILLRCNSNRTGRCRPEIILYIRHLSFSHKFEFYICDYTREMYNTLDARNNFTLLTLFVLQAKETIGFLFFVTVLV